MNAFPWSEVMRFGLGVLRLPPREFWAMTPRELSAAHMGMTGIGAIAAPDRERLDGLMAAFPDKDETTK